MTTSWLLHSTKIKIQFTATVEFHYHWQHKADTCWEHAVEH
jgi:hypothetical protein